MKLCAVLTLGLGLVVGTVLPTNAQLPLPHTPAAPLCDAPPAGAGTPAEPALVATVTRVEPNQGQVEFTTATGTFVLSTPAEIHDLRVGDHFFICLHEEEDKSNARVAEEGVAAAAGAPRRSLTIPRSELHP
jgi:hypothetical protein